MKVCSFSVALCWRSLKHTQALRVSTEQHDSRNLGRSSFTRDPLTRLDDKGNPYELICIFGKAVILVPAGSVLSKPMIHVVTVRMELQQSARSART